MAAGLRVSRQAVCMWEANKRELKVTILNKIANLLGVNLNELVTLQKNRTTGKEEGMKMRGKQKKTHFELMSSEANKVAVAGDFNSWDERGLSMRKNKNGLWKVGVSLKPGRYEYKFIVDGQWVTDPANSNTVSNAHSTLNSVKEVAV